MMRRRILPPILALLAGVAPLKAQPLTHVAGLILDPSNAGVPNAAVSVVNEDTGFRRLVRSQPDGGYLVASLQPGVYKITIRKEGFRTVIRFGVRLEVSQPSRLDFILPIGSVQETMTVEGSAPALNSEDASVGTIVGREQIERLPLNGRGLLSLIELAPGAIATPATRGEAGQFTANGQRPNTNYFTLDGVSANTGVSGGGLPAQCTGGALPGMTAFGSLHGLISLEALDEFRVQTSTVTPELGRMPGAQISLGSRSGTNELHGALLYYIRHEALAANDWFANRQRVTERAPLRVNDFGAILGGPIRRNRTFFFLSYEGMRLRQPSAWRTPVPSLTTRASAPEWAQPVLSLFPAPNGPELGRGMAEWTGRNSRPSRLDVGSIRLDHAFSPRVTVFSRYNDAPSSNEFGNTQVSHLNLMSRSLTLGLNLRLRPNAILDVRANASDARTQSYWTQSNAPASETCYAELVTRGLLWLPGTCGYFVRLSIAGLGQLVSGPESSQRQYQVHTVVTANLNLGSHYFRLGVDYRRLAPARYETNGTLGVMAEGLEDFLASRNFWIAASEPRNGRSILTETSLFGQDTWRITQRLTTTYGLRWEFNPAPVSNQPVYSLQDGGYKSVLGPIWPTRYRNLAPRFGVAYRPTAAGHTVLRVGLGLYYDSSLSIATDLVNGGPLSARQFGSNRNAPFSMLLSYGFERDLRLPLVGQWNASLEHAFMDHEVVSVAYVGSVGRRLIRRELTGTASTDLLWVALATNHGKSDYQGLQLQYRRRLARHFQAVLSYAWSHSIDDSSTDSVLYWVGPGAKRADDRGSSDFDARHTLTAAFAYETQASPGARLASRLWRGWAIDGIFRARTGFPVSILNAEQSMGIDLANAFRPNLASGAPIWVSDRSEPGGKRLNGAAFQQTADFIQGGLGRNAITGFGMSQVDLALRREFFFADRRSFQARVEAFNAFNTANFADPVRFLSSPLFGRSPSMLNLMLGSGSPGSGLSPMFQTGGARSLQVSLRLRF